MRDGALATGGGASLRLATAAFARFVVNGNVEVDGRHRPFRRLRPNFVRPPSDGHS